MLRFLIRFALRQRLLVIGAALLLVGIGVESYRELPVEAFPDVEDIHVRVISQWPGHAAEEVEKLVTLPIERQLNGTPNLSNLRSISMFGLSMVTLTFTDATTDYFARAQVLERLQAAVIPQGVTPGLGSLSTSNGEIYRYTLGGSSPLIELKALADWVIEPAFRTVPGVVDVVHFGGAVKQYQVDVDPARLVAYGVTLPDVEQAVAAANANAGGGYLAHGYEKEVIRGVGLFRSLADIENVVIASRLGVPVLVREVARVQVGGGPREGIVAKDSADDVVEGIVLMRKGENALTVLDGVRAKAAAIQADLLPAGVRLVPFYDRAALVQHTVDTVQENLVLGALLVLGVLIVFLGDWRAALIVGAVIPLSLFLAFTFMNLEHVSANLISLGAVDFGIIVDAAVVMVEAFLVRLALAPAVTLDDVPISPWTGELPAVQHDPSVRKRHLLANIAQQMGRPIFFAKAILITAFLPIFTFQRVEKRIFSPMAFTLSFALVGSLLLCLTLVPVLSSFGLRPHPAGYEPPVARWVRAAFLPFLDRAMARPRVTLAMAVAALAVALAIGTRLGTEFLPTLDEGNIWLRVTMPIGISLEEAKTVEREVRRVIRSYPQVRQVVTQLGRPDDGTDVKGSNNLEVYADLKPKRDWGKVGDKDALVGAMYDRLAMIPGLGLNFSQYIKDNLEEALSGVTGELVVKIFGPDMSVLERKAGEVEAILAGVRGVADLGLEPQFGQPQLRFEIDRAAAARYGLTVAAVNDAIETAIGGRAVTQFIEGERVFDVRLRLVPGARLSHDALGAVPVVAPDGRTVPLASLARMTVSEGASRIAREANERRIAVKCSVRGRDQGGFVAEAQALVARQVALPEGYRMVWGGQFENQRRATARLALIVPASIVLIFILLFGAFGSVKYATLVLANLPFAAIGGILILWVRNINLSVSAAVGFIALFGISVQNGVLLVSEFNRLRSEGRGLAAAVREGTLDRLRPVVMTALMAALGLLPAALSTGIGAETTRPFATVIVGGLASATILTVLLLPTLYLLFHEEPHEEIPR